MEDDQVIEKGFEIANRFLGAAGDDIRKLPFEVATFMRVIAAQGVIDNGGYRYFFESDWPGNPPYSDFVQSYRAIGCHEQADDMERVIGVFPFPEPHLRSGERIRFMNENYDDDTFSIKGWGDALCGDATIWRNLAQYVRDHAEIFS